MVAPLIAAFEAAMIVKSLPVRPSRFSLDHLVSYRSSTSTMLLTSSMLTGARNDGWVGTS